MLVIALDSEALQLILLCVNKKGLKLAALYMRTCWCQIVTCCVSGTCV